MDTKEWNDSWQRFINEEINGDNKLEHLFVPEELLSLFSNMNLLYFSEFSPNYFRLYFNVKNFRNDEKFFLEFDIYGDTGAEKMMLFHTKELSILLNREKTNDDEECAMKFFNRFGFSKLFVPSFLVKPTAD